MSMAKRNGKRGNGEKHIQLTHYLLRSAAYRDLSNTARALYVELLLRFNGSNNGNIGLGVREAGDALNASRDAAARAFKELESHGFIAVATDSTFGQKRLAREWLLTAWFDNRNGQPATKDFMKWRPEKQNPVAPEGRIVAQEGLSQKIAGQKLSYSPPHATVMAPSPDPQSQEKDTYTSSHRHKVLAGGSS